MASIGEGVEEIRVRDERGEYRVIYTARFADAVYVLHALHKKDARYGQAGYRHRQRAVFGTYARAEIKKSKAKSFNDGDRTPGACGIGIGLRRE